MLLQLLEEFARVVVLGEVLECLLDDDIGSLQVPDPLCQVGRVVRGFEHVRGERGCRGKKSPRTLNMTSPHLEDAEVVEGFSMRMIRRQSQPV